MPTKKVAVVSANCEATGHPGECQEPVPGEVQDADGDTDFTVNGVPVADHSDVMHFDSHAHSYSGDPPKCGGYTDHDLTPDQDHGFTVNGEPVMREGDSTTDPSSGGTAEILDSGGSDLTITT
jgi:uncharacterized Zn-binding protein involved in type VI secretion